MNSWVKSLSACAFFVLGACNHTGVFMPSGVEVVGPQGYYNFCAQNPGECSIPVSGKNGFRYMDAVLKIDAEVRDTFAPMPDPEGADKWSRASVGDCEDFALNLRHKLRARFPEYAPAFRIATAWTEQGQYHAVLAIETPAGTWVCDQRFPECLPWHLLPYKWDKREVLGRQTWEKIGE